LLADADTGHVLAARNAHEPRPPASTIKLLSAVSALPEIGPDITYTATSDAANIEGSKVGLVPDQEYTLDNILHGMFLASGNDTAYALGELVGGQERMLDLMNSTADELGAFDTEAKTPHGLDTEGQLSSAYDLALIGREALHNDQILELAGTPTYDFPGLDDETYQIQNTNRLLGSYEGVIGLKNGFTTEARHTLVAAAQRGGTTLLAVVMGTDDRAEASVADLLDWGFSAVEVDPVGELVTREDVIAAAESRDADATEEAEPTSAAPRDGGEGSAVARELSEPILSARVAMLGGAVAVVSILGIAIKRRPRPGGRYSSGRR
jgi:D-alanyl-D-alanine carboxypeptidase (penicillin-binding protein 5/6)